MHPLNEQIARQLEEVARLLREQGADSFRIRAYLRAAAAIRSSREGIDEIYQSCGLAGLKALPHVGDRIARSLGEFLAHGHLAILDRLRGEADPITLLASVPSIGPILAERLHNDLGLETLADLEAAAHDGRLATVAGFGEKRLSGIRDSLAHRLGRVPLPLSADASPPVSELLDVDREYRDKAAAGELRLITPRRFNPTHEAWLPILHTRRGVRHYTALFSNTVRAHDLRKTRDWVVLYSDNQTGEARHTVITAAFGPLRGRRVVAGREDECEAYYTSTHQPSGPRLSQRRSTATVRDRAS